MESKFGIRDVDCENHWKQCQIENFEVSKPLVICLSGNATITEVEANGFCKLAEELIGDNAKDVELLGVTYGHEEQSKMGELSIEEIDSMIDNILMPLCKEDGELLSTEKICKNLSSVTFFTFCHGHTEVSRILARFSAKLYLEGVAEQDIDTIKQAFLEITYSKETNNVPCPQVFFASASEDVSWGDLFTHWYFDNHDEHGLDGKYAIVCDKPGQFCYKDSPNPKSHKYGKITVITDSILKNEVSDVMLDNQEHSVGYFKAEQDDCLNENGKILKDAMAISLQERIKNSLANQNGEEYLRFYLQNLDKHLEEQLSAENRLGQTVEANNASDDNPEMSL